MNFWDFVTNSGPSLARQSVTFGYLDISRPTALRCFHTLELSESRTPLTLELWVIWLFLLADNWKDPQTLTARYAC